MRNLMNYNKIRIFLRLRKTLLSNANIQVSGQTKTTDNANHK